MILPVDAAVRFFLAQKVVKPETLPKVGVRLLTILRIEEGAMQRGPVVKVEILIAPPGLKGATPVFVQQMFETGEFSLGGGDEPAVAFLFTDRATRPHGFFGLPSRLFARIDEPGKLENATGRLEYSPGLVGDVSRYRERAFGWLPWLPHSE